MGIVPSFEVPARDPSININVRSRAGTEGPASPAIRGEESSKYPQGTENVRRCHTLSFSEWISVSQSPNGVKPHSPGTGNTGFNSWVFKDLPVQSRLVHFREVG